MASLIKWTAGILLVICLVLAGVWVHFDRKLDRQLKNELARLKGRGVPLTIEEVLGPPVDDDHNAAVLYLEVFGIDPAAWQASRAGTVAPTSGLLREVSVILDPGGGKLNMAQVKTVCARADVQDMLYALRRASLRPQCAFPVRWEDGPHPRFPHLTEARAAARVVSVYAGSLAQDGNVDEALDWYRTALRMARHIAEEPMLFAQLIAYGMQATTLRSLRDTVCVPGVSVRAALEFEAYLRGMDCADGFRRAITAQRAFGLQRFSLAFRDQVLQALEYPSVGVDPARPPGRAYYSLLARPLQSAHKLNYLRCIDGAIARCGKPYREAKDELGDGDQQLRNESRCGPLAPFLPLPIGDGPMRRDAAIADIEMCRVVMALRVYHDEHGAYPGALAEVQSALGGKLPQDPFSGANFVYKRQPNGFVLYSIGPNLQDDGGIMAPKPWKDGDLVWSCPRVRPKPASLGAGGGA